MYVIKFFVLQGVLCCKNVIRDWKIFPLYYGNREAPTEIEVQILSIFLYTAEISNN